ncbi:TlpA family protein disulfide reductase [Salinimicrobium sp. TH3]|uniref:TlpA family protein disulfide reductase n=1 Tax=Salinimicrobium sp. TH3 TaxID=2997342 RepID=UPI0022758D77|nr:hypothetical protein [Salinimicrobium sp. TH3]MCY2687697.1 hypothetical protein [Salinimicrobium sp. TH3]
MKSRRTNISRYVLPALLLLCLNLFFTGCKNSKDDIPPHTYIGGKIINPTTEYIVIKNNGSILDSIRLDNQNRFSYKIENAKRGLYLLEHKPETQNIYLSPGDSLLFRVNTLAFDESLHFSGRGNEKNNFLTEMFLKDEHNSQLLLSFHKYPPEVFLKKVDSIKHERFNTLNRESKKRNFSEDFVGVASNIITYENNDLKEKYTYLVNKYYKEYSKEFPKGFHDYRKDIDFNCGALQSSPAYKRFLENYLINYSLSWCATSGLDKDDCYSLTNVDNVKARLQKAGELIGAPTLRKEILEKIAVRGIVMAKSREDIISILRELQEQNLSEEDIQEMKQLGTIQLAYLPGTTLEGVPLLNMAGELIKMGEIIDKPTVIFLWSAYSKGHQEEHRRINQYREKYPEINFIGINLDLEEEPAWRVAVRQNGYNPETEFQLGTTSIEKEYFSYFLDKILFLNSSGEVVVGDIYLSSPDFESRLLEFLN